MNEFQTMIQALNAELKRCNMTLEEFTDTMGWGRQDIYQMTGTSRPYQKRFLKVMKWMLYRDMDVPGVCSAGFAKKYNFPLGILESEESRRRVAKFALRLWVEEQEEAKHGSSSGAK